MLGECSHLHVGSASYCLPRPGRLVFCWVYNGHAFSRVPCLFWGADLRLWPSWRMSTVQNSKNSWLAMESASLGSQLPFSGSGCPPHLTPPLHRPACPSGRAREQPDSSPLLFAQSLFCERTWQCLRLGLFTG